jgi:hypothetical protein
VTVSVSKRRYVFAALMALSLQANPVVKFHRVTRNRIVNLIPTDLSGETTNNSEPSIAVNPANPRQM